MKEAHTGWLQTQSRGWATDPTSFEHRKKRNLALSPTAVWVESWSTSSAHTPSLGTDSLRAMTTELGSVGGSFRHILLHLLLLEGVCSVFGGTNGIHSAVVPQPSIIFLLPDDLGYNNVPVSHCAGHATLCTHCTVHLPVSSARAPSTPLGSPACRTGNGVARLWPTPSCALDCFLWAAASCHCAW